jgi:hypothetical protein
MLDFTRMACPPPVIRDVTDTIERLIHYIRDEGHVATLTATLAIEKELRAISLQAPFSPLPSRIHAELTDPEYLVALARGSREANAPFDLLRYFGLVGAGAAAAVWELLSRHADDAIHAQGCTLLLSMDGLDIEAPRRLSTSRTRVWHATSSSYWVAPRIPRSRQRCSAWSRRPTRKRAAVLSSCW